MNKKFFFFRCISNYCTVLSLNNCKKVKIDFYFKRKKIIEYIYKLFLIQIYKKRIKFLILKNITKVYYFNSLNFNCFLNLIPIFDKKIQKFKIEKTNLFKIINNYYKNSIFNFNLINFKILQLQKKDIIIENCDFYIQNLLNFNKIIEKLYIIKGIITIIFTYSNISIYLFDVKKNIKLLVNGNNFTRSKKLTKHTIVSVFNNFILLSKKYSNISVIGLHIKGLKKNRKFIKNRLKKHFYIQLVLFFTNHPYNGCRLKKVKRKKNFTKRLKFFNFLSKKRRELYTIKKKNY
jgi:hypothetical protein